MAVMILGKLQLGTDAVSSGNKEWLAQTCWKSHEPAKPAETSHNLWAVGGLDRRLDALNKSTSSFYINTCAFVIHGIDPVS
jgi:hypothetical protein